MTALILAVVLAATSHAPVSVPELERNPDAWNGRQVVVTGEIVGDYSIRSDVVWVQVNDDAYAETPLVERNGPSGVNIGIGVRIPRETFDERWGPPGGYTTRGPIVEVSGLFRYNSAEDQGETFVDAGSVRLLEPARAVEPPRASGARAVIGGLLTVAGLVVWWGGRRRRSPTIG